MTRSRRRPRVVVAGLGDTGLLTAIHLAKDADVVGISAKPGLVSGQELGMRLSRPDEWARDYWIPFERFRKLDDVRVVRGTLTGLDPESRTVTVQSIDGADGTEPYDALVIATGVSNGFWRRPNLETPEHVDIGLRETHARIAAAASLIVVGGGSAAVSSALNVARTWPEKRVDLYFPGDRALTQHHRRVWSVLEGQLRDAGVGVHPGHRAVVPEGFAADSITDEPIQWSTGQDDAKADAVLWTIGNVRPNSAWLPSDLLDENGFVRVDEHLRVVGRDDIYAVGDVAATDPLRTSARSRADHLIAHNVVAGLTGGRLKRFKPAQRRWGSVVGTQDNTLEVFTAQGRSFKLPAWSALQPFVVRRSIYKGIRDD